MLAKNDKKAIAISLKEVEDRMGFKFKKPVCSYSIFMKNCR